MCAPITIIKESLMLQSLLNDVINITNFYQNFKSRYQAFQYDLKYQPISRQRWAQQVPM